MISIAAKLRPFSHLMGAQCVIPGTDAVIEAYPHFFRIGSLEIPLDNDPLIRDFTLCQDLERNCVWVFGKGFRFKIAARLNGFEMVMRKETKFFPASIRFHVPEHLEHLSLGSHKKLDWDLVLRRLELKEILPVLYHLGQKDPVTSLEDDAESLSCLESFYLTSFHHMNVPKNGEKGVLRKAFEKTRSLFVRDKDGHIHLLPNNPFSEGRMLNIQTEKATLDIEWTKKRLRRVILHVRKTGDIFLDLPKEIRSFRIKTQLHDRGTLLRSGNPLQCVAGSRLYLDRFFE